MPLCVFSQVGIDSLHLKSNDASKADTIVIKENLLAFKDTIIVDNDTLIITKEVWIRQKDSLVLTIDTIFVNDEFIVITKDSLFTIEDTVVVLQDTIISRNERVLQQIKEFSEKNNFFSRLLRKVLVFEVDKTASKPIKQSDKIYEVYEGKVIRNIEIKVLDPFGHTLSNIERKPRNILGKGGNVLHLQSQKRLIRNKLLFSKYDRINSLKISESERLIRANNYIYDARIIVYDSLNEDSVDVFVVVQDIWSISAGVDFLPGSDVVGFSVRDVNFLGLGQQIDNNMKFDPKLPGGYNYRGNYTLNNIYKTFISAQLNYRYENGQTIYGAAFNRDFFSPAIKWAGGSSANWYDLRYQSRDQNDSILTQPLRFLQGDVWLGYGINISTKRSSYKGSRFILSGRIIRTNYYQTPIVPDSVPFTFNDSYFYLSSFGIINRRYYKDSYIFRFGKTEDIPEGNLVALVAGLEDRGSISRPYLGVNVAYSTFSNKHGYLYGRIGMGSFYENSRWAEGVLLTNALYFTPLIKIHRWKWRHFLGGRYSQGINQLKGSVITINQDQGVRGFSSNLLQGTSKFVINYEMNIFPPLNLLGFRMAGVLFADFAWISDNKKLIDKKNFFPGYGVGIRIRNDHLVFSTIQLLLGYYPNNRLLGEDQFRFFERNKLFYNFDDFQFGRPSIIPFN